MATLAEQEGNVEQDDADVGCQIDAPFALLGLDGVSHDGAHRACLAVFRRKQLDHLDVAVEVGHGADNKAARPRRPARPFGIMGHRHHRNGDVGGDPDENGKRQRPGQRAKQNERTDELHQK